LKASEQREEKQKLVQLLQSIGKNNAMKNCLRCLKTQIIPKTGTAILSIGLCLVAQCARQTGLEYSIEAVRSQTAIRIDGFLDEAAWQMANPVLLKNNRSGQAIQDNQVSTSVMTCYDDSTLYIAFVCNDPDIWANYKRHDEHLWKEEAVEVFIDADEVPDTYVEIEVSPANVLFDSYIVDPQNIDIPATAAFDLPGIRTAVNIAGTLNVRNDIDNSWHAEIAVPFRDLATERTKNISAGSTIKINFFRLDKNQGMASASYAWSPTGGRFHKPAAFGRLFFIK
jgi:hypothetical protein